MTTPGSERAGRSSRPALKPLLQDWGQRVWRFFTSVRLALILILVLTGLTLIGTLLIQVPTGVGGDRAEYIWWRDTVAKAKLGIWAMPLAYLGLLDVFHSPWFLGGGVLLMLNIIVCSLNRWKEIRSSLVGGRVRAADGYYEWGSNRAQILGLKQSSEEVATAAVASLKAQGYRVRVEQGPQAVYLAADRNRYFRLGTYLHHASIVLLIVGFLIGSYMGFRNQSFVVPEGSVRDLGAGTGLSMKLVSFVDEYWPSGPPKDYRSEVVLYENGQEVQQGLIRVNHPLSYKGIRFYQSSYGQAAVMQVRDSSGALLYDDAVGLAWLSGNKPFKRPTGMFSIPNTGLTAYVVAPAQGYFDPLIQAGQARIEVGRVGSQSLLGSANLDVGAPQKVAGLEFTFVRERQFSLFQVSRDPGNMLIWIASTLFVLGLVLVFYFPHRRLWARADSDAGGTRLMVRTTQTKSFAVASDFESVVKNLEQAIGGHATATGGKQG